MNPLFHTDFSISDSLKSVRKSVLIYETIIQDGSEVYTVSGSCIESLYFDLEDLKEEEETEETDTTEEADVSDGSDISTDTQESE